MVLNGAADSASCVAASFETCSFSVDLVLEESGTYSLAIYDGDTNEGGDYQLAYGVCCASATAMLMVSPMATG